MGKLKCNSLFSPSLDSSPIHFPRLTTFGKLSEVDDCRYNADRLMVDEDDRGGETGGRQGG